MREQARHRRPARISVAPIKTSPSLQTSDGALTTGVDLLELRKRSEDGEGTVLEANPGSCSESPPAHVRRIKHSDVARLVLIHLRDEPYHSGFRLRERVVFGFENQSRIVLERKPSSLILVVPTTQ